MKAAWLMLPAALAAGVIALVGAEEPTQTPAAPADAPVPAPDLVGMADEILGITEAISIPPPVVEAIGNAPDEVSRLYARDARETAAVGARWVRGHTANSPFLTWTSWEANGRSFADMDMWVQAAQVEGLSVLGMLGPWPGNRTGAYTDRYVLPDPAAYAAFVQATVERYDGDGVDDMPGLRAPIHDWEVDNEPDLKNTNQARGKVKVPDPATFCTPAEYAEVLRVSAAAMRAADPAVRVHNGGFYRPMTPTGLAYMQALVAIPGVLEAVDVVSIHGYISEPETERLSRGVANARALFPGRPVRITETSVPSAGDESWLSPAFQADMVFRIFGEGLRQGLETVFWHSLVDPPVRDRRRQPGLFSNSLFQAMDVGDPVRKPAADAYERLAKLLKGLPRSAVRAEGEGVWLGERYLLLQGTATMTAAFTQAERASDGSAVALTRVGDRVRLDASVGPVLASP